MLTALVVLSSLIAPLPAHALPQCVHFGLIEECDAYDPWTGAAIGTVAVSPSTAGKNTVVRIKAQVLMQPSWVRDGGSALALGVFGLSLDDGGIGQVVDYGPKSSDTVNASGGNWSGIGPERIPPTDCGDELCGGPPPTSRLPAGEYWIDVLVDDVQAFTYYPGPYAVARAHFSATVGKFSSQRGMWAARRHITRGPAAPAPPPTAGFTATADTMHPGSFLFSSTSTSPDGQPLIHQWDFGDGSEPGTGLLASHAYDEPGDYEVTLKVIRVADGASATTKKTVTVAAPRLGLALELQDGVAPPLEPDEPFTVRATVTASDDGIGDLTGLTFDEAVVTATPPDVFALPDGPATPPTPFSLAPGGRRTFEVRLQPTGRGSYALLSTIAGKDAKGRAVTASATSPGVIGKALEVALTVTPKAEFTLEENEDGSRKPTTVTVTVEARNTTAGTLKNVSIQPLDMAAQDPLHPYTAFPAEVVGDNAATSPVDLDAGETTQVEREVRVSADGLLELTSLVSSDTALGLGTTSLRVGVTTLLEMELDGEPVRTVTAGGQVRFRGRFTNVTNDQTIAMTGAMRVIRRGNLWGGGMIARADGDWLTDPFPPPLVRELGPGESAEFQVRFTTERPTALEYDEGVEDADHLTEGFVSFALAPRAAVEEEDGSWSSLTTLDAATSSYPRSIRVAGGTSGSFDVTIDTTEQLPVGSVLDRAVPAGFGMSVGALEGAQKRLGGLLHGVADVGRFTVDAEFRDKTFAQVAESQRVDDALTYLSEFAVWLPAVQREELSGIVGDRLHAAYQAIPTVVDGEAREPSPTAQAIDAMVDDYLRKLQGAWRRGDRTRSPTPYGPSAASPASRRSTTWWARRRCRACSSWPGARSTPRRPSPPGATTGPSPRCRRRCRTPPRRRCG